MVYIKDQANLSMIANKAQAGEWLYSIDGQNIEYAVGFFQKTKVFLLSIVKPIFGDLRDKAILNLFPEEIQPFILELDKIEKLSRKRWGYFASASEWDLAPFDVIKRDRKIQELINSIDGNFVTINQNLKLAGPEAYLLERISSVFSAAFIADAYFTINVFNKLETYGAKDAIDKVYIGKVKDGSPHGEGILTETFEDGTRCIYTGTFETVSNPFDDFRQTIKKDYLLEVFYPNGEKIVRRYKDSKEIDREIHFQLKRAI